MFSDNSFVFYHVHRLLKIKEWIDKNDPGSAIIPFSGELEMQLIEMENDEEREAYLKEITTTR